ncbi:MAG: FAD-binding oxidoreductase [Cyclobacteriaceae bacterium]
MNVDYLIVGQGIAGSLLALELEREGSSVMVLNEEKPNTSSNKAAGIYNPITGRKMVKTWLADELFTGLEAYYKGLENQLSSKFLYPKPIYRPFFDFEEQNDWSVKATEAGYAGYVKWVSAKSMGNPEIQDPVGGLMLKKSGFVNLPVMLAKIRKHLVDRGSYQPGLFSFEDLTVGSSKVTYRDIEAEKIIFCEGPDATSNPYWQDLPFKLVKGEILEIACDLSEEMILNRSVFVLPKNETFHVGSTYDHQNLDYKPTEKGIKNLQDRLHKVFKGNYTIVNSSAGVRPATYDRRPFIGTHPDFYNVAIFNGFGTKGVSLVPYFAHHFVNYLAGRDPLMPEVDIKRVRQ